MRWNWPLTDTEVWGFRFLQSRSWRGTDCDCRQRLVFSVCLGFYDTRPNGGGSHDPSRAALSGRYKRRIR